MAKEFRPLEVESKGDEPFERLVKRFMRKVRTEGVIQEVMSRRGYEKPSEKRRRKQSRARAMRKAADKQTD